MTANANFLGAMGYWLAEIQGRHHRMFMPPDQREGDAYRAFWGNLNRGNFEAGEFERFGRGGKEIWIQASYNPVLDPSASPSRW